jgi:hypothetical protein
MIRAFDMVRLAQQTGPGIVLSPTEHHAARVKGLLSALRRIREKHLGDDFARRVYAWPWLTGDEHAVMLTARR